MAFSPALLESVRSPSRAEDLGLPLGLAEDLFLRRVLADRATTLSEAAQALCITHAVADELASGLRDKALIEFLGANGRDFRIQLTERGTLTTHQRMTSGRHVGPMPLPLSSYQAIVAAQCNDEPVDRDRIRAAFQDLYVEAELLDQLGPAFVNDGAVFLYGPAGTGKTSLAERMNRISSDPVLIPRYVEVDSQIISVYDPALHRARPEQPPVLDRRWVLCERPLILVGGELDLAMLDLRYDRISGISAASIGMLANNGILVIDDFGRQSFRPEEILNRWIVPMSRGVDFLKAATGTKLSVPFEVKLVISTNLDPTSLGDDAFLRRLRNKVFIGPITEEGFRWVLADAARRHNIELTDDAPGHLVEVARREMGELRPYLAVDFCQLTLAVCAYEGWDRLLDVGMIDRVGELYFVQAGSKEMDDRPPSRWRVPEASRRHDLFTRWNDYQIGHVFNEDPLEGLDALAATLSFDGLGVEDLYGPDHLIDELPAALRPPPPASMR
jgi:hypothetical protein